MKRCFRPALLLPTGKGASASGGRIKRGAGWNYEAFKCAVDYRYNSQPYEAADSLGFRVARSLPED
jgi:formylglycine-generating enzyme required for sulfatase activity